MLQIMHNLLNKNSYQFQIREAAERIGFYKTRGNI